MKCQELVKKLQEKHLDLPEQNYLSKPYLGKKKTDYE